MDQANQDAALNLGSRRELFVDDCLVGSLDGVGLKLHTPQPAGVALRFDKPWEGQFSCFVTVLKDGGQYLMYYAGAPSYDLGTTCYATSPDGIHWTRPNLRLHEVCGQRENNVLRFRNEIEGSNFSPFIDTRPGVPAPERFKAVMGTVHTGLSAFVSGDGIHWRKFREEPLLRGPMFRLDSQNVAFWSEHEGCYVLYYRTLHASPGSNYRAPECYAHGTRWVGRVTSPDFIHWSDHEEMEQGDAPYDELYVQQTHPYFRAPHIYISLAARFIAGREVVTAEQARALRVHDRYWHDVSDVLLLTSRGGNRYTRTFLESFIRPGLGYGRWVSRTNFPALGVVPTGPTEMSAYVGRLYAQPEPFLERMILRTDGFASVNAASAGGQMTTKPFIFSGSQLEINYSTSAAGHIQVEIQDGGGRPIEGYALADADAIIGDELARVVAWQSGTDLSTLAGRPVRLRFAMKDADLYSLRFRDPGQAEPEGDPQ